MKIGLILMVISLINFIYLISGNTIGIDYITGSFIGGVIIHLSEIYQLYYLKGDGNK